MLQYFCLTLGELSTNCYVLWDEQTKKALILDPADDAVAISEEIRIRGLNVKGILSTHGHYDHLLGAYDLQLMYRVPFYANSEDMFLINRINHTARFFSKRNMDMAEKLKIQIDLSDVAELKLGQSRITVLKTPGHTPGSVCFYCPDDKLLFTGDTLTKNGHGSTAHKYSSRDDIKKSIRMIQSFPIGTLILAGHEDEFLL